MKNEKGLTLISLVITVVLMIILTFTVTFSGMETLEYSRMKAFVSDMQMIQEKVNLFCDKASAYGYENNIIGYIKDVVESENKLLYPDEAGIMEMPGCVFALEKSYEEYVKQYYRYLNQGDLSRVFGLTNIDREVIINFYTREVIDLKGITYQTQKYYTQYDLPGGDNVIGSDLTVNHIFEYTGSVQETTLMPGEYKLEVWGAQGGNGLTGASGGHGGYSAGILNITEETKLYIQVGGQGNTYTGSVIAGGYNGGGCALGAANHKAGSGGGATDIRIGEDSLHARVIVAGGGGRS